MRSSKPLAGLLILLLLGLLIPAWPSRAAPVNTTLVSTPIASTSEAIGPSSTPSISANGRYVAFASVASNLVSGDTNGFPDIFVRDTQTSTTTRVSVDSGGNEANGPSYDPSISADGRYVAFASGASNLVSGDTNGEQDIFVRDTQTSTTTRVSVDSGGNEANGLSLDPSISANGRYVAFASVASNLVSGDTNGFPDIFVRDTQTSTTFRVSVDSGGNEANGRSFAPSISADGRYVAFWSVASNLVSGDTNGAADIFVRDTQTSTTTRVSVDSGGNEANGPSYDPSISADGRYVAFVSEASNLVSGDTNGYQDIFVRDTQTSTTFRVSVDSGGTQANGFSFAPSISADGRYVAFVSEASNLVSGDTNGYQDIFVRDTQTSTTFRVSVDSGGTQANGISSALSISADGRYVAFASVASNLVSGDTNGAADIFVRDTQTSTTGRASIGIPAFIANNASAAPSISADGRYVAFSSGASNLVSGDTNATQDIFVRDTQTSTTTRVSVDSGGNEANSLSLDPSISANGRYVAFASLANNLVSGDTNGFTDIFVRDTQTSTTTRVSVDSGGNEANGRSFAPSISADGRYVAFWSVASNLVSGDTNGAADIFVRDTQTSTTTRVSVDSGGNEANGPSYDPSISADGRYVAFVSEASNLVSGDTNGAADIFVRDTQTNTTTRVSVDSGGNEANGNSSAPSISANGRYVAFSSGASNLVSGDTNGVTDIFVRDTQTSTTTRVSVDSGGTQANNFSSALSISADGRYVAFVSEASNLVSGDTNGAADIFVRDTQTSTTFRVSVDSGGNEANGNSSAPSISADGRYVAFESFASNLVSGDTNGYRDIFVHEYDNTAPTVASITRADPNPTNAASVSFTVTFSEAVSGVAASDFSLTASGGLSGASVTGVSGSGSVYTVTVATGTGNGTLRLDVPSTATIADLAGNGLSGLPFTSGEVYDIQTTFKVFLPSISR